MRQKLLELGANTIATLPKLFKSRPSFNGICLINVSDFFESLKYYGYNIIKEEAVLLCRYFDPEGTENINFEKFLFALRGKPNASRQATIDYVYSKFDKKFIVSFIYINSEEDKESQKVFIEFKNEQTAEKIYRLLNSFSNI